MFVVTIVRVDDPFGPIGFTLNDAVHPTGNPE
jgi:hypothetical protein